MGWLIGKIREWFCKHEWDCIVNEAIIKDENGKTVACKWLYVCKKCMKKKEVILSNDY